MLKKRYNSLNAVLLTLELQHLPCSGYEQRVKMQNERGEGTRKIEQNNKN